MKTFIRWQGNKSKHINKFIEYIPEFTGTYIEPFVGSGALLLKLQADTKQIKEIFKEYHVKKFQVYRMGSKSYVNELLIMNYTI